MTKPMIRVHNLETDEIIDREMTDEEYTQYQADEAVHQAQLTAQQEVAANKAALLAKLGITEEEAKLLLS